LFLLEETFGIFPALKASRECPLLLDVKVCLREGKVFGSEEGAVMGSGLYYIAIRGKKLGRIFTELKGKAVPVPD
jgi:hypothetical protein